MLMVCIQKNHSATMSANVVLGESLGKLYFGEEFIVILGVADILPSL